MTKKPEDLRSARWFAPDDLRSMGIGLVPCRWGSTELTGKASQ